jgi:hypothetical protein
MTFPMSLAWTDPIKHNNNKANVFINYHPQNHV